jgi:hypothetical protein
MDPAATQELLEALLALAAEKGLIPGGAGGAGGAGAGAGGPPPAKTAAETGSTITGDKPEQENHESQSANAEAKMDLKTRPEPYAAKGVAGVGKSDMPKEKGRVGEEDLHAGKEPDKMASLTDIVKKMASSVPGSTISKDDSRHENKPGQSPNAEAKLDLQNRSVKEHLTGVGKTELHTHPGAVGQERKHDGAEAPKSNAVKSAAYVNLFEITATEFLSKLPSGLDDYEKVAAIKTLMGFEPEEQEVFVQKLAEESDKLKELAKDEEAHHGHLPSVKEEHKEKRDDEAKGKSEAKKEAADACKECSKEPCECKKEESRSENKDNKADKVKMGNLIGMTFDPNNANIKALQAQHGENWKNVLGQQLGIGAENIQPKLAGRMLDKKASVDDRRSASDILRGLAALSRR